MGNPCRWLKLLLWRARIRTFSPRSMSTCAKRPPRKPLAPVTRAFVTLFDPLESPRLRFDEVLGIFPGASPILRWHEPGIGTELDDRLTPLVVRIAHRLRDGEDPTRFQHAIHVADSAFAVRNLAEYRDHPRPVKAVGRQTLI